MSFHIHASLQCGKPCLRIVDAASGKTCLHWCCETPISANSEVAQQEMHHLFRRLLLLSTQQQLATDSNFRHAAQCDPAPDPASDPRALHSPHSAGAHQY